METMTKYTSVSGIYLIVNTKNGRIYIGQSQDINSRWASHKRELNGGYHPNQHLQRAWGKYGAKVFKFQKLEYCPVNKLDEREQHYLNLYLSRGICYNIAIDVTSPSRGRVFSAETRAKMKQSFSGHPVSEETRRKISISMIGNTRGKGHTHTDESRRKMSVAAMGNTKNKGRVLSEETKRKISAGNKNRPPPSDETRKRMSESAKGNSSHKGFAHDNAARLKMSMAAKGRVAHNKGKSPNEETRKRMSEAAKRRHALKQEADDN
jgi:group I intron endonuclease